MKRPRTTESLVGNAALHALGALPPAEAAAFEGQIAKAPAALRREADEFRAAVTRLARLAPPVAPRPELRSRLLGQVAGERKRTPAPLPAFFFARADEAGWEGLTPGVSRQLLTPGASLGERAQMVRLDPGAVVFTHEHHVAEHCYVVSGDVWIAGEHLGPGDYHLAGPGTTHREICSDSGCVLLIVDGPATQS